MPLIPTSLIDEIGEYYGLKMWNTRELFCEYSDIEDPELGIDSKYNYCYGEIRTTESGPLLIYRKLDSDSMNASVLIINLETFDIISGTNIITVKLERSFIKRIQEKRKMSTELGQPR